MERDLKSWCMAFFEVDWAYDAYENDMSESFNYVIDLARKRPLLAMLEEIQIYAMERAYKMLLEGQSWDNLKTCPSIRLKTSKLKKHQKYPMCACNDNHFKPQKNAEDYVAPGFHTTMFLTCYNHIINPLNGSSMWPEVSYMKPLPPQKEGY
ncbi:unnamed protein product [Lactuca saligna]|uniref:Uncharacterized protein n=1 Tax=Lactuca saligna TaxID=75948 RepID=A0AA35ZB74_LACSI|nr:unnamed protein product [Lactuca saligna]